MKDSQVERMSSQGAGGQRLQGSPPWFYALVFGFSIPFWIIGFDSSLEAGFRSAIGVNLPVSAFAAFCPLIAAFVLVHREDSKNGVKKLMTRIFARTIKQKIWYAPSILLMPFVTVLSYATMSSSKITFAKVQISILTAPLVFLVFFVGAVGEEGGYMGYVFDAMYTHWSALETGLVMGSLWAAVHLVPYYFQQGYDLTWIAWQVLFTIAARVIIIWLYSNTGRSVLSACLFHATINSCAFIPSGGSLYNPAIVGPLTAVAAVIVTFLWGSKTLARYRYSGKGPAVVGSIW